MCVGSLNSVRLVLCIQDLFHLFRTCGNVENVRIVTDMLTGLSKCYGFVKFDSEKVLFLFQTVDVQVV